MLDALPYLAANGLWIGAGMGAARRFRNALRQPRRAQEAVLQDLLRRNAATEYGGRFRFGGIGSPEEFQDRVPVVTYDDLQAEIEQVRQGRRGVLTAEPVLMLEKTSGSSAASKYIPYTARLKREFGAAVAPWMADLYLRHPRMLRGGAYWSVSPLAAAREVTEGGLTVGFEEDTEYFGPGERMLLNRLMLTPRELPRVREMEASRYVTLRFLLQTERLSFISIWNPSFLTLLVRSLEGWEERLIQDIRLGTLRPPSPLPADLRQRLERQLRPRPERAARLAALRKQYGSLAPAQVWPQSQVISCWADGSAAALLPELRACFPQARIQPKGLLATEGVVSIPLAGGEGAALAVTSHFLEFVDESAPGTRPRLADELETGRAYQVLLTTGGGLYRYALGDRIQVTGWAQATPRVRFLGRAGACSDLCGEKLEEGLVREVLEGALLATGLRPRFAMLAPEWTRPPAYVLFLEAEGLSGTAGEELARRVEAGLEEGYHYGYCRRLGQLGPVRLVQVRDGSRAYEERCAALGQRRGAIKPAALHREPGWSEWFEAVPPPGATAVPAERS
jgi:hypothetical protein